VNADARRSNKGWTPGRGEEYCCFRRNPTADPTDPALRILDHRGLPRIGAELRKGCQYYMYCRTRRAVVGATTSDPADAPAPEAGEDSDEAPRPLNRSPEDPRDGHSFDTGRFRKERCFVEAVEPVHQLPNGDILAVRIRARLIRDPVIGDKFSSQHGQKGTLSLMLPAADMPFTDTGMVPDLLINPHAFPSRMTVGMMLELLGGKLGALDGRFVTHEATAWATEGAADHPHDILGRSLVKHGYDYYGDETMYSGQTGEELRARVYVGCCAYQRLRHMVMDKWQVRESVGPSNIETLQPVKGRSRHGGVKVGEMERDALLSHGCVKLVADRLYSHGLTRMPVCRGCGRFLTLERRAVSVGTAWGDASEGPDALSHELVYCAHCAGTSTVSVALPFAFVYLCSELLALNMELCLHLNPTAADPVDPSALTPSPAANPRAS
jgi:DNA-directed RNA polymerase beta subunit